MSEDSVVTDNEIDGFTKVGLLRKKHIRNLFFGHLNIKSLRNKREYLEPLIRNHFDIFLVSETKLDSSFPWSEYPISGYRLFRKDRDQHGGALIFYVNQDIPRKTINSSSFPNSLEVLPLEINLRNKKILVSLDQLHSALSFYSTTHNHFLMLDDFTISRDDERFKEFCNSFSLGHLIQTPIGYMGTNLSSIDYYKHVFHFYEILQCRDGNI